MDKLNDLVICSIFQQKYVDQKLKANTNDLLVYGISGYSNGVSCAFYYFD